MAPSTRLLSAPIPPAPCRFTLATNLNAVASGLISPRSPVQLHSGERGAIMASDNASEAVPEGPRHEEIKQREALQARQVYTLCSGANAETKVVSGGAPSPPE